LFFGLALIRADNEIYKLIAFGTAMDTLGAAEKASKEKKLTTNLRKHALAAGIDPLELEGWKSIVSGKNPKAS